MSEEPRRLRSFLGYGSPLPPFPRLFWGPGKRLRKGVPLSPHPSACSISYVGWNISTKPRMHGPFALQPLCMIIENPRDTSQPHSRVIYYYFVSITSEMTGEGGGWMGFSTTLATIRWVTLIDTTYTDGFFGGSDDENFDVGGSCVLDGIKRKRFGSPITFGGRRDDDWWRWKLGVSDIRWR